VAQALLPVLDWNLKDTSTGKSISTPTDENRFYWGPGACAAPTALTILCTSYPASRFQQRKIRPASQL